MGIVINNPHIYIYVLYIYIYVYIYIDDFPIKASIFRGFPIAMFWLLEGNQQKQGFFSGEYTWMAIRSELDRNHDGHGVIDDHPLISKAHDVHTWLTYSVVIIQNKGMDRRKKDAKAAKNPRVGPENLEPRNFFLVNHWGYHHFACQNHAILISGRSWSNVWVFGPRMIAFRMRSTWDISHMNSDILDVQRSPLHHHRIWWVHVMINGRLPGVINSDGNPGRSVKKMEVFNMGKSSTQMGIFDHNPHVLPMWVIWENHGLNGGFSSFRRCGTWDNLCSWRDRSGFRTWTWGIYRCFILNQGLLGGFVWYT